MDRPRENLNSTFIRQKLPNAEGEIEICSEGSTTVISEDSYSLKDFGKPGTSPGYYVVASSLSDGQSDE